jgi:hypothetical protein
MALLALLAMVASQATPEAQALGVTREITVRGVTLVLAVQVDPGALEALETETLFLLRCCILARLPPAHQLRAIVRPGKEVIRAFQGRVAMAALEAQQEIEEHF